MLKKIFILVFVLSSAFANAQFIKGEFGILAGASYYLGDVNHSQQFYSAKPAFGLLYRKSFNSHYALRTNLLRGKLSGNDTDFSNEYQNSRQHSFENTFYELSSQFEINFLPFNCNRKAANTTYITAGLALMYATASDNKFKFTIPIGMGYKRAISKKLTLGIEWVFRNTFSDNLDLLENTKYALGSNISPIKQMSNANNKDWYSIALVTLSYKFKNSKQWCPAYKKNKLYNGIK